MADSTFGDSDFQLTATSSSNLPVSYLSSNTNVATINGNIVTIVGAGTTTITASQPGNANYSAAQDVSQVLIVNKANQNITFNALTNRTFGDSDFQLTATSSSNLPVSYVSSNTNVATINGNTVTIVGAGTANITANQTGNANYNAAQDITQLQTVNKADQTITFNSLPNNVTYGQGYFQLNATSSSNMTVTYTSSNAGVATINGNNAAIVGAGTTTITASQSGDINYNAATDVTQTLTIGKASQNITFNALQDVDVNDPDFSLTATSDSGLPISYSSSNPSVAAVSGNIVSIHSMVTTTFTASQPGNNNYNAASDVTQILTVTNTASFDSFKKAGLGLFPNPVSENFTLKSSSKIEKVTIFSVLGKKVKEFKNITDEKFFVTDLKRGVYIIKVKNEKGTGITKFLKLE